MIAYTSYQKGGGSYFFIFDISVILTIWRIFFILTIFYIFCILCVLFVFDNCFPGYELSDDENEDNRPNRDGGSCDEIQPQHESDILPASAKRICFSNSGPASCSQPCTVQFFRFCTTVKRSYGIHIAIYSSS